MKKKRRTRYGATRKTTKRDDRKILRQALVDSTATCSTMKADVGVAVVTKTISRQLALGNMKSKRPFLALPLTPEHRQLCQQWNTTDWQKMIFSDESRFVLSIDDNRVQVWRRPGERYNFPLTVVLHTAQTVGIMVWGAIAYDSRSTPVVVHGTLRVSAMLMTFFDPM